MELLSFLQNILELFYFPGNNDSCGHKPTCDDSENEKDIHAETAYR